MKKKTFTVPVYGEIKIPVIVRGTIEIEAKSREDAVNLVSNFIENAEINGLSEVKGIKFNKDFEWMEDDISELAGAIEDMANDTKEINVWIDGDDMANLEEDEE